MNATFDTAVRSIENFESDPLGKPSLVELATAEAAANCVRLGCGGANPFHEKVWLEAPLAKPVMAMPPIFAAGAVNWPAPLNVREPEFNVTGATAPTSGPGILTV